MEARGAPCPIDCNEAREQREITARDRLGGNPVMDSLGETTNYDFLLD